MGTGVLQGESSSLGNRQHPPKSNPMVGLPLQRPFAALPCSLLMLGLNQYFDVSITNFMVGCPALRGPARDRTVSRT